MPAQLFISCALCIAMRQWAINNDSRVLIIQILTAMLHRYAINTSQEGRKSSAATHKHDALMFINLLDKCTQILREDRIWVRNQLKNNDEQVLAIFREAKKPINLQHLQIRLRKHVTAVKSKAKMEQLIKFKQNMHLGDWVRTKEEPPKAPTKRDTSHRHQLSAQNQNLPSAARAKNNSSLQKTSKSPMIYPYRNSSAASKRNQQPQYPALMEQITQRESENMTSARHRVFAQETGAQGMTFSHTYQPWRRPDQPVSSPLGSNFVNDPFKPKFNQTSYFNNYIAEPPKDMQKRQQQFVPAAQSKKQTVPPASSDRSNSGTLQFYQNSHEQQSQNSINNQSYFDDYSPNAPRQTFQPVQHTSFLDTLALSRQNKDQKSRAGEEYHRESPIGRYNQQSMKEPAEEESNLLHSKHNSFANNSKNDSLFTSPELLAECRNFLKLKSSAKPSTQKQYTGARYPVEMESHFQPLKFDTHESSLMKGSFSIHNQGSSMQQIFNEINAGMTVSVKSPNQMFVAEPRREESIEATYQLPKQMTRVQNREQFHQIPRQPTKQNQTTNNGAAYEYFHTFAGLSSQKKPQLRLSSPGQFVDLALDNTSQPIQGFIEWDTLEQLVYQRCPQHIESFRQYLLPGDEERLVLISNIGRLLQDLMETSKTGQTQNQVRSVYRLLDIEQKGFITEQDIDDFIRQLEDSEAEDIDTISQCLWRLYETIDQDAEEGAGKKIDYWGLYSKKTSSQFNELNEILKQFEFQIE